MLIKVISTASFEQVWCKRFAIRSPKVTLTHCKTWACETCQLFVRGSDDGARHWANHVAMLLFPFLSQVVEAVNSTTNNCHSETVILTPTMDSRLYLAHLPALPGTDSSHPNLRVLTIFSLLANITMLISLIITLSSTSSRLAYHLWLLSKQSIFINDRLTLGAIPKGRYVCTSSLQLKNSLYCRFFHKDVSMHSFFRISLLSCSFSILILYQILVLGEKNCPLPGKYLDWWTAQTISITVGEQQKANKKAGFSTRAKLYWTRIAHPLSCRSK